MAHRPTLRNRTSTRRELSALGLLGACVFSAALLAPRALPAQSGSDLAELTLAVVDTIPLPSAGCKGLAFQDSVAYLLMSSNTALSVPDSNYSASILRYVPSTGRVDTLLTEPGAFEAGLAFDLDGMWAGGNGVGGAESLFRIALDRGGIVSTLPAAGYHPGGLVWDEEYLWQIDADGRQLARIETEEGKVSRRFPSPGFYPTGLAYDGFHFWNADASTGRIYRIRAYNGRADGVVDELIFSRPGSFVSLGWDGRFLWTVAAEQDFAIRYAIAR